MTMSNLASEFVPVYKNYDGRYYPITKITIHHMVAVTSGRDCAIYHRDSDRQCSANYYIGNAGDIVCGVAEEDAAWTSSSWDNDNRAITMEVSNSVLAEPWPISNAAWQSMIKLCADICNRYGIEPYYDGTPNGTFTEHRMFAPTGCPGDYIHERMYQIVEEVKKAMNGSSDYNPVQVWTLSTLNDNQLWKPQKNSDGTYTLVSKANGMSLDVQGAGNKSGTAVQAYKKNDTAAQKWSIKRCTKSPSGYAYSPKEMAPVVLVPACATKLRLSATGKGDGAGIQVRSSKADNLQRWTIVDTGTGYWALVNVATGKALDLKR